MKNRFALPTLIFSAGLVGLSQVATAAPDAGPADAGAADSPPYNDAPQATDNAAGFLGVAVAESVAPPDAGPDVPETVLLVSQVMPDSPADGAGLRTGDVLLKIDGQVLLHPVQFRRLIALQAPGNAAKLTILRNGERQTLEATIGQRPAELAPQPDAVPFQLPEPFGQFDGVPFELQPNALPPELQGDLQQMREQMDRQFEQIRQMFRQGMNDGWPGGDMWQQVDPIQLDLGAMPGAQQVTVLQDPDHKITVTQNQDGRHLLATDRQGNVLFDGPIDTPAQLNAVPQELRDKLPTPGAPGNLENPFKLQLRGFPGLPLDPMGRPLQPQAPQTPEQDGPGEQLPAPAGRAV